MLIVGAFANVSIGGQRFLSPSRQFPTNAAQQHHLWCSPDFQQVGNLLTCQCVPLEMPLIGRQKLKQYALFADLYVQ